MKHILMVATILLPSLVCAAQNSVEVYRTPVENLGNIVVRRTPEVHEGFTSFEYEFVLENKDKKETFLYRRHIDDTSGKYPANLDIKAIEICGTELIVVFNEKGKCYAKVVHPIGLKFVMVAPSAPSKRPYSGDDGAISDAVDGAEIIAAIGKVSIKVSKGPKTSFFHLSLDDDGVVWSNS